MMHHQSPRRQAGGRNDQCRPQVRDQPQRAAQGGRALPDRAGPLHGGRAARGRRLRGLRAQPDGARRGARARGRRGAGDAGGAGGVHRGGPRGEAPELGRLRDGEEPRRQLRRRPGAADPRRDPCPLRRRGRGAGGRRDQGGGARRRRGGRRRVGRAAGARRDRRGRAGDPSRGAGQPRLRLGVRRRGRGRADLRRGGARDAARARRQPGDGDADGGAGGDRDLAGRAADRRLLGAGGVVAARRARGQARAAEGGGAGDDAGRGRRLRDQGVQLPGVFRRRLRGARARAAGALDEQPRRGDADRQPRARPCDGRGGGVRRGLPAAGAAGSAACRTSGPTTRRSASTSPRSWR